MSKISYCCCKETKAAFSSIPEVTKFCHNGIRIELGQFL